MKQVSVMLKPASSLCNMRCRYCFYADVSEQRQVQSFGIMSRETARRLIANVLDSLQSGDTVTFAFQGGEPTLAGLDFFRDFVRAATEETAAQGKQLHFHYALQTNGLLLDGDWCRFLREQDFLVGLSLDGSAEFHDENRLDAAGKGTFSRVIRAKRLLEASGVQYNILWVLSNRVARFPQKVWKFLCEQDIRYVQFIPCLAELNATGASPAALTPERFSAFYTRLLPLWAEALRRGEYRSIKFFDDFFNLLLRRQVTACGFTGQCSNQLVVEADGSVYPCDFYVLDAWNCGDLAKKPLSEILSSPVAATFLRRPRRAAPLCEGCRWKKCAEAVVRAWTGRCMSTRRATIAVTGIFWTAAPRCWSSWHRSCKTAASENGPP